MRLLLAQYQAGTVDFSRVRDAERNLLKAQLELAETPAQRTTTPFRKPPRRSNG